MILRIKVVFLFNNILYRVHLAASYLFILLLQATFKIPLSVYTFLSCCFFSVFLSAALQF